MKCEGNVEEIARMLEGSLSGERERLLRNHLSMCPRCRAELRLQGRIDRALAAARPAGVPAGFTARVAARTTAKSAERRRTPRWVPLLSALSVAAAAAAIAGLGAAVTRSIPEPSASLPGVFLHTLASATTALIEAGGVLAPDFSGVLSAGSLPFDAPHTVLSFLLSGIALLWGLAKALAFLRE